MNIYNKKMFFLGNLCKREHRWENSQESLRYVKGNRSCCECVKEYYLKNKGRLNKQSREYNLLHKEEIKKYMKQYVQENRKKINEQRRQYYQQNKEKTYQKIKEWRINNKEKIKIQCRINYKKKRENPTFRLHDNIRTGIYRSLKRNKNGFSWEKLVGYSLKNLKFHLEKQFDENMDWKNYGSYWVIDHIIPINVFNFEKSEDVDFKKCWALKNLQPLERKENILKSNKLKKPFQPSLLFKR